MKFRKKKFTAWKRFHSQQLSVDGRFITIIMISSVWIYFYLFLIFSSESIFNENIFFMQLVELCILSTFTTQLQYFIKKRTIYQANSKSIAFLNVGENGFELSMHLMIVKSIYGRNI